MIKIMRGDGLREDDANVTTIPETRNWLITLVRVNMIRVNCYVIISNLVPYWMTQSMGTFISMSNYIDKILKLPENLWSVC